MKEHTPTMEERIECVCGEGAQGYEREEFDRWLDGIRQEAYDAGYHQAKEDGDLYDTQATYTAPTLNNGDTK